MADPNVDLFAGMKKKSKKKQVALDLGDEEQAEAPAPASASAPAAEEDAPAPAPIQKKGDKFGNEEEEAPATEPVAGDGAELFGDLKKKKKKKKDIPLDLVRVPFGFVGFFLIFRNPPTPHLLLHLMDWTYL